jgi:hypothetical protein
MASNMKVSATKDSTIRETTLVRLFNGEELNDEEYGYFSCKREALLALKTKVSGEAKVIGGLNKHYDFTVGDIRGELKHSVSSKTGADALQWRPWQDGVQFLQGQTKSKEALLFMGECGPALWSAWYEQEIKPFAAAEVPTYMEMTADSYFKVASGMKVTEKQASTPAGKFILALRSDKVMAERLRLRWLAFEERWMPEHLLNHSALDARIRKIIEEKDVWVAINKSGAHWIEGFNVLTLTYDGCFPKAEGGRVFKYRILLRKKSGGETKEVPISFKLYWKNGGQAVQNLNFMII